MATQSPSYPPTGRPAATGQVLAEKMDELSNQLKALTHQIKQWRIEQQAVLSRVQPLPNPANGGAGPTAQEREHSS